MNATIISKAAQPGMSFELIPLTLDDAYATYPSFKDALSAFEYISLQGLGDRVAVTRAQTAGCAGEVQVTMTAAEADYISMIITRNETLLTLVQALKAAGV